MSALTAPERVVVAGLDDDLNDKITELLYTLRCKRRRNEVRTQYYDGKRALGVMSQVVPPWYHTLGIVLGWTAKAVDLLARRCSLDGFGWPGGDLDELGMGQLIAENNLIAEVGQAVTSALLHSCVFAVAHKGGPGEPAAMIHFRDAMSATGTWNPRTRRLDDLISVTDRDEKGQPVEFTLYVAGETIDCDRVDGRWQVTDRRVRPGPAPVEMLPYKPRLSRPFGQSRITRSLMGIQDQATRELIRLEGHMDVYSWPEFWMLGADESIFVDASGNPSSRWQVMLGRIKAIPDDDDAEHPRADVKHFPAASPEPHLAATNAFAKLFAREASLPDTAMAITDVANPTSAESYDASQYELIAEAEGVATDISPALARITARALAIAHGEMDIPAEWASIAPMWRDPRFESRAAMADAGMKMMTAVPWLAETEVGLSMLGLSPLQISLALAERRRLGGSAALQQIIEAAQQGRTPNGASLPSGA